MYQKKYVIFVSFSYTIRHWFGVTGSHDMELLKRNADFHNKCSYRIEKALKPNDKRCVLIILFGYTIRHWFRVTGPHDMEFIEKKSWIFIINNHI